METTCARHTVTELRLSAFSSHRGAAFPLGPLTLFTGASGSGKTTALRAYEALARLGAGASLREVFADPVACVPEGAPADGQGRRGFRFGCTVDGPAGPVRLDLAVQAGELVALAAAFCAEAPVRLMAAIDDASLAPEVAGVTVVDLGA
jgi:energy-coupling factor transporter ATP-binding protein EcfA2